MKNLSHVAKCIICLGGGSGALLGAIYAFLVTWILPSLRLYSLDSWPLVFLDGGAALMVVLVLGFTFGGIAGTVAGVASETVLWVLAASVQSNKRSLFLIFGASAGVFLTCLAIG